MTLSDKRASLAAELAGAEGDHGQSLMLTQSHSFIPGHHSLLPLPLAIGGLRDKSSWAGKGVNACADGSVWSCLDSVC